MNDHDHLIKWLNEAHTMEQSMLQVLEGHALLAGNLQEIRSGLEKHRAETLHHRDQVAQCLRLLGQQPSSVRTVMATASGVAQGVSTILARDAILKNAQADYAAESAEIALYTTLITAAEQGNRADIAALCRGILEEEVEMAAWLEERIPELTVLTLAAREGVVIPGASHA